MRYLYLVPAAMAFLSGCTVDLPGEPVGTFAVLGELSQNECGVSTPLQFGFVSQLRSAETGQAWWLRDGAPRLEGAVVEGEFQFQKTVVEHSFGEFEGCRLVRSELLYLAPNEVEQPEGASDEDDADDESDSGEAMEPVPPGLKGRFEMIFQSQGDCSAATRFEGGPFAFLPCVTVYDMSGWEQPIEDDEDMAGEDMSSEDMAGEDPTTDDSSDDSSNQ